MKCGKIDHITRVACDRIFGHPPVDFVSPAGMGRYDHASVSEGVYFDDDEAGFKKEILKPHHHYGKN